MEGETHRKKRERIFHPLDHSPNATWPGLGQVKSRDHELIPVCQGPKHLDFPLLLSQVPWRELEEKQSSWDSQCNMDAGNTSSILT